MNKLTKFIALILAASSLSAYADPVKAEDDAYAMAIKQTALGYQFLPSKSGLAGGGSTVRLLIPVTKGIDYVFLVGKDALAQDIDMYVYDETQGLILDDRRSDPRAGTKFRASYSGTVEIYIHMARANGLASWALIVGSRGGGQRVSPVDGADSSAPKAN